MRRGRLMSGPRVDVYVGKDNKDYSLPKDLLCDYSTYFDRCFNGKFNEAKEGKLGLLEDSVEDFEILLEYMLRGCLPLDNIKARNEGGKTPDMVRRYMELLEYADKYNMQHGIGEFLYDPLKARLDYGNCLQPEDVELVFRVFEKGNKMKALITQAALSQQGPTGEVFRKQEEDIPEFAQQMLAQIRSALHSAARQCIWLDPLTFTTRAF